MAESQPAGHAYTGWLERRGWTPITATFTAVFPGTDSFLPASSCELATRSIPIPYDENYRRILNEPHNSPPPDCLHGHLPGPFLLFWVTRFCFFLVCLIFSFLFSALDWPANLVSVWAHLNYTVSYRIRHQRPETKLLLSERAISDDRRSSFSHPTGNCGVDNGREILHDSQRLRETDSRAVHAHRHTNNFN